MQISVELSAIIILAVTGISWLAGLSFGLKQAKKDIENLQKDAKNLDIKFTSIWKELSDMNKILAKIDERTLHGERH